MTLPGTESQPHAAAVLSPALPPQGRPSHAYLLHGPPGTGKRAVARAFAAALLADGAPRERRVAQRVASGSHPDLTWVRPTGAAEMRLADIEQPVIAASSRTPFEATRRVFVIEDADRMSERAGNTLLKTLEEPPPFAHLLLLASRRQDVLATIVSRCQLVRFDPLPSAAIERSLAAESVQAPTAAACARLALGDAELARRLARPEGAALRAAAETLAGGILAAEAVGSARPWSQLLTLASTAGSEAAERAAAAAKDELELLPARERRRREREAGEDARRVQRRERTRALDLGLRLLELWLRDMVCVREGAPELVHALDRSERLQSAAASRDAGALREAVALVGETRLRLAQNVAEELALQALSQRLQQRLAA